METQGFVELYTQRLIAKERSIARLAQTNQKIDM